MKRLVIVVSTMFMLLCPMLSGGVASANSVSCGNLHASTNGAGGTSVCQSFNNQGNNNPIITILRVAMNLISVIAGGMAVVFIIVAAIRFITSGGGSEGLAEARNGLIYVIVGVMVIVLSQAIINYVLDRF